MLKTRKNLRHSAGFTIIELVIVIVVIGILAAVVLNTVINVQAKARDTERKTDMRTLSHILENYYNEYGSYPSNNQLTDYAWIQANIPALAGSGSIVSPLAPSGTSTSIVSRGFNNTDNTDTLTYHYSGGKGYLNPGGNLVLSSGCASTNGCTSFILGWKNESDGALNYILSLY